MKNPGIEAETPDFDAGLHVSEKPGAEFACARSPVPMAQLILPQSMGIVMLIPVAGFFLLRDMLGMTGWGAGVIAGLVAAGLVFPAIALLMRVSGGPARHEHGFEKHTDTRYRVRAIIPRRRRDALLMRWAGLAMGAPETPINADELGMIRGGFEPIVCRPWLGIVRDRRYAWTAVGVGLLTLLTLVFAMSLLLGGWRGVLRFSSFAGYGVVCSAIVGGVLGAELLWPAYLRLAPGRLDIFRYGLLGSGDARVERFDLRQRGVCVDFGKYRVSLEPARPAGEGLPALVRGKRWPHAMVLPEGFDPVYLSVAMVPGRREFAQRLIQAARTDEAAGELSITGLGE